MCSDDYQWHHDYARLALDTGFSFETYRTKPLDKIIGSVNVDHLIRDRDVAAIEKYIPAVIEFSLDNDQTSVLDPTFVKIFQISQLSVQYLLFCKKYLDSSIVVIKQEYHKTNEENKNFKRQIEELCQEASNYKKQIKELKTSLNSQIVASQNIGVFQCQECPKAFSTEEYLLAHIKRRHESLGAVVAPSNTSLQSETNKLQLEIKELKERLNNTERFVSHNEVMTIREYSGKPNHTEHNTVVTELQTKFEHLKTHVDSELRILQTQKFEKEKYEKWFETFLSNKLNAVNTISDKAITATTTTGTQGEIITNNCSTQTEFIASPIRTPCKSFEAGDSEKVVSELDAEVYDQKQPISPTFNTEKLEERLHIEAQNRLQRFEELLEEKVTGSIEKLESQMQTFFVKINDKEEQRAKTQLNTSIENFEELTPRATHSRTQVVAHKNTSTSQLFEVTDSAVVNDTNFLPITKTVKKPKLTSRSAHTVTIKKFCSSSSESEEESESEESETDDGDKHNQQRVQINKPVVKISATSTLGRRSLTSLKEVAFTPKVLTQLQNEIEKIINKRLQEVGVNPKSKRLPVRPYQRALGIVSHQASIMQKNVSNYLQIRRQILKDVDNKIAEHSKPATLPKNSKLKVLLNTFKGQTVNNQHVQSVEQKPPHILQSSVKSSKRAIDLSESEIDVPPSSNRSNRTFVLNKPGMNPKNSTKLYLDTSDSESIQKPDKKDLTKKSTDAINLVNDMENPTNDAEAQTKGVLKYNPIVASSVPKKKVIFDLDSAHSKENIKPLMHGTIVEAGSTTSIASSVLDISKASSGEAKPKLKKRPDEVYDLSDWELSEVSTTT